MRIRGHRLLTAVFDIAMLAFAIFSLPHFLKKSKLAKDQRKLFRERLGKIEFARPAGKRVVWIHAVSVGEVAAIKKCVERLREELIGAEIIISTVTPTGQATAESLRDIGCHLIYFPFDLSFIVRPVLDRIQPDLILLAETEIWPNFILSAKDRGIPVGVINGRMSEKSVRGYRKVSALIKPVFQSLDFILVQTEADKQRYAELGVKASRIHVLGNMKFDQVEAFETDTKIKAGLGYRDEDQILIAGSTHPGEEKLIFETVKALRQEFPNLKVIVAPRHPERAREVAQELRQVGLPELAATIIDRVGVLKKMYAAADVVVMGGSFIRHGGQNPIEPALAARAILSGPNVFNFRAVYETLVKDGGAQIVSQAELTKSVRDLLKNPSKRNEMGQNAKRIVVAQQGATERHVHWIKQVISSGVFANA